MSFNLKIHTAQENIENTEIPAEESDTFVDNQMYESPDISENFEVEETPSGEIESPVEPNNSEQMNEIISQGALDVSGKFEELLSNFGLDQLGTILSSGDSQEILNDIVNRTIGKISAGLAV